MSRRPSLPGAAELFRSTGGASPDPAPFPHERSAAPAPAGRPAPAEEPEEAARPSLRSLPPAEPDFDDLPARPVAARRRTARGAAQRPSGRERHEEKITVYCSAQELVDLEQARLALRAEHGVAVDRGRIVREAVAVVLADLEAKGESSIIVRRLRES